MIMVIEGHTKGIGTLDDFALDTLTLLDAISKKMKIKMRYSDL